jgi:hypothetical protein
MIEYEDEANQVSRFGWFAAGVISALVVVAIFFFLGDHLFSAADVEAGTPLQIIEAQ